MLNLDIIIHTERINSLLYQIPLLPSSPLDLIIFPPFSSLPHPRGIQIEFS